VFSPDGREVISADHAKYVRVWNAATTDERLAIQHPAVVWGLAVSPDGRYILTGTGGTVQTSPEALKINQIDDNTLRLWELSTGNLVREMKGHTHAVYTLDISPDGRLAASGGWDGTIRLWDLESGQELCRVEAEQGRSARVLFSPDGRSLIVGGGGRREGNKILSFPNEQIRMYRLVAGGPDKP
jgi:WD40 repeat protein